VTLVNRGRLADPFDDRVERIRVNRSSDAFDRALAAGSAQTVSATAAACRPG
jgi:hypothetical protein